MGDEGSPELPDRIFIDKKFIALNKAIALSKLAANYALYLNKKNKGYDMKNSETYWDCWYWTSYLDMILKKQIKDSKKIKKPQKDEFNEYIKKYKLKKIGDDDLDKAVDLMIEFGCLFGLMDDKLAEESIGGEMPEYF